MTYEYGKFERQDGHLAVSVAPSSETVAVMGRKFHRYMKSCSIIYIDSPATYWFVPLL